MLNLPSDRVIGQLHDRNPGTFRVADGVHAAHDVNQLVEPF
jgi:hypothetical protein